MKKTLSIILALVFVLSMCTFGFAEEAEKEILPGLINQFGDWSAVEGGYKANSVSGMIVLDQQMGAGVFEATVKRGTEKVNDTVIYLRGTGFDTIENFDGFYTKTTGLKVLFNDSNGQIGFYNNYKNEDMHGPGKDGATGEDYTKFPYDTWLYNVPYGEEYALRIEFGTGGIRVIVNDKVVVEKVDFADKQATTTNTDIKCPMGTQIAIQSTDDTFTNIKLTPWDASNDADWTSDCDSLTNAASKQGFAYNGNVVAPAGSTVSFDVTADNFKEGTGNNGFFFGGDHLYGANSAEKDSAVGKGMNYWMVYFNNSNTAVVKVINANWNGRVDGLKDINFASIIPENAEEVTINVTATYTGRSATITFKCGDKSVTENYTLAEGAKTAAGNDAVAPSGSEVAFRVWNGKSMTFSNIKVDGKAINEHDTLGANGACSVCGYVAPKTGDATAIIVAVVSFALLACGAVLTLSKKRIAE